jgi:hypothetical protein
MCRWSIFAVHARRDISKRPFCFRSESELKNGIKAKKHTYFLQLNGRKLLGVRNSEKKQKKNCVHITSSVHGVSIKQFGAPCRDAESLNGCSVLNFFIDAIYGAVYGDTPFDYGDASYSSPRSKKPA